MAHSVGPLSVVLSPALRDRLKTEARKRGLKLSSTVRVLVAERVREMDESAELSAVDEWQRAQAWATWEAVRSGDATEVAQSALAADFERAAARARRARSTKK